MSAEQLRAFRDAFEAWWDSDENRRAFPYNETAYKAWLGACEWMNARDDSGEAVALNVEVRRCDVCDHIGISDVSETQGACHECDWQGDEPVEDKCPGCGHTDCMAAACPECGGRYALIADRQFTHPRATAVDAEMGNHMSEQNQQDVRDAERYRYLRKSAVAEWRNGPGLYWNLPRHMLGNSEEKLDQHIDAQLAAIASREGEGK